MIDIEHEAERQIDRPLTTTLTEAFEAGARWVLEDIKSCLEDVRTDLEYGKRNEEDLDYIEQSILDLKERLEEYV